MSAATLQLRNDLLVSRHGRADGSFFVIKDPATERYFRFGEAEHFIAQQLDGATPVETVRERVEEREEHRNIDGRTRAVLCRAQDHGNEDGGEEHLGDCHHQVERAHTTGRDASRR